MDEATKYMNDRIKAKHANSPEIEDPKNRVKIVFIYEGFEPYAHIAWMEMIDIAQGHGMKMCDIIVQPQHHEVMERKDKPKKKKS